MPIRRVSSRCNYARLAKVPVPFSPRKACHSSLSRFPVCGRRRRPCAPDRRCRRFGRCHGSRGSRCINMTRVLARACARLHVQRGVRSCSAIVEVAHREEQCSFACGARLHFKASVGARCAAARFEQVRPLIGRAKPLCSLASGRT